MRKLLLLVAVICLTCMLVSPALSAELGKVYLVPAKIVVYNEGISKVTDPTLIKALEKHAKDNQCVLEIEIPGGDKLYISYCGNPTQPICVPSGGKMCCPGRTPVCQ